MFKRTRFGSTAPRRFPRAGLATIVMACTLAFPTELPAGPSLVEPASHTVVRPRGRQAAQQQAPEGEIVRQISIEGNTLDEQTIKFLLSFAEGDTFDWATAQQDFRTMLNSDLFDDVQMRWHPVEGGIRIVIEVLERPILRDIRFEGSDKGDKDALLERMEMLKTPIVLDRPIDRRKMARAGEVLTTMLQGEEGLQFGQVEYSEQPALEGSGVDVVFDIVEGETIRIENVYFDGVNEFTQREMRWMAKRTSEHWLLSFLTKNDRYSPTGVGLDHQNISNEYKRRGYLDIEIGTPEVEVYDIDQPWPLDDTRRMYLRVPVKEGPQYRLGEVQLEGNTRFTDEQLALFVPLNPGDVLDVKGVIDAATAMKSTYSNLGYFDVNVFSIPVPDSATGVADIRYVINENAVYAVRRIEFEGNINTRDYVMRRNLQINENDLWSQARVEASKFKIQQLGYFDNIEEEVTTVENTGSGVLVPGQELDPTQLGRGVAEETGEVDITLKVSEVGRQQINFGGNVSALQGSFVSLGYATRNLFGRGQTFSFNGQFGGRTTTARVSFLQPYLFDKSIRFGFDVFRSRLDFVGFQQKSAGISTRIGLPLDRNEFTTLFLEYNYTNIDIGRVESSFFGLSNPIFRSLFLTEGKRTTSSVRPNVIFNTINSPFNPSRGRRHIASLEYAGGPLGGSLDFVKGSFTATWYRPIKARGRGVGARVSQVFAFNVDFRVVEPLGDLEAVPIFERFFLGGSNSVRGTRLRAIGPVDQFGNIVGGTRALQYNIEYILALADPVRIALFHDAGAAWDEQFSLPLSELRKTAGVEFRAIMPVFNAPLRFFWAYNFDPLPQFGEQRSSFEFAIGTTF